LEIDYRGIGGHHRPFCVYVFEIAAWSASVVSTVPELSNHPHWVGANVPAIVPWLLSFLNGATILGFLFASLKQLLSGQTGVAKGVSFGLIGWLFMELIFFPVIGLGPFAVGVGLGIAPAILSFGMILTYSIVPSTVYTSLDSLSRSQTA
jgi:uncharacterized protein DUF6789